MIKFRLFLILITCYTFEFTYNVKSQAHARRIKEASANPTVVLPTGPKYDTIRSALDNIKYKYPNNPLTDDGEYVISIVYYSGLPEHILGDALASTSGCAIRISDVVPEYYLENLLIHEILHCLGYVHLHEHIYWINPDIMAPFLSAFGVADSVNRYFEEIRIRHGK